MSETTAETTQPAALAQAVLCGNEDHEEPVAAYARVTWPGRRFEGNTACKDCLLDLFHWYVLGEVPGEQHSVHIELIEPS